MPIGLIFKIKRASRLPILAWRDALLMNFDDQNRQCHFDEERGEIFKRQRGSGINLEDFSLRSK
jgi:hypothetical protein